MGVHPYCIAPAGHEPSGGLRGLDGSPVDTLEVGALSIWVSRLDRRPEVGVDALRTHHAVGRAAIRGDVTPLPVRFGNWVDDPETLVDRIRSREDAFHEALRELAGTREFGLRILDPSTSAEPAPENDAVSAPPDMGPGRAYLEKVARERASDDRRKKRRERVLEELRETLGGVVREERSDPLPESRGLVSVAHLVRREDADAYGDAVERFRRARPELRLFAVGPWPPYTFSP